MTKLFFEQMESRRLFAAGTLISVPDSVGAAYDPVRNRLYVASGSAGEIHKYDAGTSQMLEPIRLGAGPIGQIDLSPDGTKLYTIRKQVGTALPGTGTLFEIDLVTREVTRVKYLTEGLSADGESLAVDWRGKVVFGSGSSLQSLHVFDSTLPKGGVAEYSPRIQFYKDSKLLVSGDRKVLFVPETTMYVQPAGFYDVSLRRRLSSGLPGDFNNGIPSINFDGTLAALPSRGVFDRSFKKVAPASAVGLSSMFVKGTPYLVSVDEELGVLRSYNLGTGLEGPSWSVEGLRSDPSKPWEAANVNGQSFISPDGATAFVALKEGYREVSLPGFPYDAPRVTGETSVVERRTASLSATVEYGPGGDAIEWDTNYDGVTFTVDAVGSTVALVGPNGPGPVTVAARVGTGERTSRITTWSVNVVGAAPTGRLGAAFDRVSGVLTARVEDVVDVPADVAAGMKYDFDLDGDGVYEIAGSTSSVAARVISLDTPLPITVRGRITDVDGLSTAFTARVGQVLEAVIGATPETVDAGMTLTLDGTNSLGATLPIAAFEWDLDYDGSRFDADLSGTTVEWVTPVRETALGIGERTLALRVTDTAGVVSVVTRGVRVVKLAPAVLGVEAAKAVGAAVSRTVEVRVRAGSGLDAGSVAGSKLRLVGVESGGVTVESSGVSVREDGEAGVYVLRYVLNAPGAGWTANFNGRYAVSFAGEAVKSKEGVAMAGTVGEVNLGHVAAVSGTELSVALLGTPTSVRAGKTAKVTVVVRNEGSVASGSGARVRVLFSSDRFEGAGDDLLARVTVPARIKAGASRTFSATIKLAEARGESEGFLLASLDRGRAEPAENSGNNWAQPAGMKVENKWYVQLVPTLTRTGPAIMKPGAVTRFHYFLRNLGNVAAAGGYELRREYYRVSTDGSGDEVLQDYTRSRLNFARIGPGKSVTGWKGRYTNDPPDDPGEYYAVVKVTYLPENGGEPITMVTESSRFTMLLG